VKNLKVQAQISLSDLSTSTPLGCSVVGNGGNGKRLLAVEGPFLIIIEKNKDPAAPSGAAGAGSPSGVPGSNTGVVREMLPLQIVEAAVTADKKTLILKYGTMTFENEAKCKEAFLWIEKAKKKV
jgi:hypothetical protein